MGPQAVCSGLAVSKSVRHDRIAEISRQGHELGVGSSCRFSRSCHRPAEVNRLIARAASKSSVNVTKPSLHFPEVRFPRCIEEISNGDHILGFGADLSEDHPGFSDKEYKRRRSVIADLSKLHVIGEAVPEVEYSPSEIDTWGAVFTNLSLLYPTHACKEYLDSLPQFGFQPSRIPQLQELSEVLKSKTGWQIRPVAGLLHPRDFLNGLAFKYFHSTQYVRHGSNPMYTPEPDVCHEVLGHVPMLANASFADVAYAIGLASLGASEKDIWHLTKLYWYTVEFGVVQEGCEVKAFGAGLLSSYGELEWLRKGKDGEFPKFIELDPFSPLPKMNYKDGFQKVYFSCSDFADVANKMKAYAKSIQRVDVVGLV